MQSTIVIGANWGDEGKGLMTDYLCKKHNADLVIRFNGGAQAGHTVVTPEGKRHVFAHIGSGYFLNVPTYLSEYFILNPIIFRRELEELEGQQISYSPIYISPKSEITTYWDMLANRAMEEMRGEDAHGSCGVGINATLERAETISFKMNPNIREMEIELRIIRDYWKKELETFATAWEIDIPQWVNDCFSQHEKINERFIDDLKYMQKNTFTQINPIVLFARTDYAVFEGAQGLALDQFYGNYPYVTRSNTGMRNVIDLWRKYRFFIDEIVYVSRTYETRHGNDPFFNCDDDDIANLGDKISDKTNIKNEWQGELRYRRLRPLSLAGRIRLDLKANNIYRQSYNTQLRLALTHADQVPIEDNRTGIFYYKDQMNSEVPLYYEVSGETRENVKEKKP